MLSRRRAIQLGAGATLLPTLGCGKETTLPLDIATMTPKEEFQAFIKAIGTLETEDVYIWFKGVLWGAIPGRTPMALCGFQGLARHRWKALADGRFSQTAYDVGFFSDLEAGQPTDRLINPLTGEEVETYHNKYGGFEVIHSLDEFVKSSGARPSKQETLDWSVAGDQVILTERSIGKVPTKLLPEEWPRETSGPTNFYGGETSYAMSLKELSDPNKPQADYDMFWSSFSPWEPWLLMDGAAGVCQWRATGMKLKDYKEAPRTILDFVARDQPNYFDEGAPWEGYRSATDAFKKDREPAKPR